ncbi:MAG: hypothetical protein QNI84_07330 [Henriciella sp.]|nr:hypothetical protein [Henriciella sp.]
MRTLIALTSLAVMAACASSDVVSDTTVTDTAPVDLMEVPSAFDLAMSSVEQLVAAGNEPTAIDRLTQLLGVPELTEAEKAEALYKRGELRFSEGHDVLGAISDFSELINTYENSLFAADARYMLTEATHEAETLQAAIASGDLSPTEEFEARFRLGAHQDAADLMLTRNLTPSADYILDMFQMGYLCDDDELTGPSYDLTEPDGTDRIVRFCEFGK